MSELQTHLTSIFLTMLVLDTLSEMVSPVLWQSFKTKCINLYEFCLALWHNREIDGTRTAKYVESQMSLLEYSNIGLIDDYAESTYQLRISVLFNDILLQIWNSLSFFNFFLNLKICFLLTSVHSILLCDVVYCGVSSGPIFSFIVQFARTKIRCDEACCPIQKAASAIRSKYWQLYVLVILVVVVVISSLWSIFLHEQYSTQGWSFSRF